MSNFLSPVFNEATDTDDGDPANAWQLEYYIAGGSTHAVLHKDILGAAQHPWPIVLNARGEPPFPLWIPGGVSIDFVLKTDAGVSKRSIEDVSGIGDTTSLSADEWTASALTPTYISATSFSVPGDYTSELEAGRRIRTTNTGGTIYSTVKSSSFGAGITTVVVVNDSSTLDSGLSSMSWSFLHAANPALPLRDSNILTADTTDASKTYRHELGGLTTATGRVGHVVDEDHSLGVSWNPLNFSLSASVGSNALTVAVKNKAGADASATSPVFFKFRSATATDGTYSTVALTAALSIVAPSGAELGTVNGIAARLWLVIFNDAGTLRLGIINTQTTSGIFPLSDDALASSTTIGTGSDSAGVIYSDSGVTTKALRVLGYLEITEAAVGVWATGHTKLQVWSPGMKLPGDIVQRKYAQSSTFSAAGAATFPADDTVPQVSEGNALAALSVAITPTAAVNLLVAKASVNAGSGAAADQVAGIAMFQSGSASAVAVNRTVVASGNTGAAEAFGTLQHTMQAGGVGSITFSVRGCIISAENFSFNGAAGASIWGGLKSWCEVVEVMA